MSLFKVFLALSVLFISLNAQSPACTTDAISKYKCLTVTSCTDSDGVCECANGKRCVWSNYGQQTVNCPCFDFEASTYHFIKTTTADSDLYYCVDKFSSYNCGYETTCSPASKIGTCKCPDNSFCVWNGDYTINCPCDSTYPKIQDYVAANLAPCQTQIRDYKCVSSITCEEGIGSCTCADGTLCAWSSSYNIGCPCN